MLYTTKTLGYGLRIVKYLFTFKGLKIKLNFRECVMRDKSESNNITIQTQLSTTIDVIFIHQTKFQIQSIYLCLIYL